MSEESTGNLVLSDLLNRVLDKGVVINGHVTISIADVDLLEVDLRLLLTSVETAEKRNIRVAEHPHHAKPSVLPGPKRR
jgi:hypothetical protein